MSLNVIALSGSMGSGKTTVLGEASDILFEQRAPHAVFDLDAMATVLLPDDAAQGLNFRNLAAIRRNVVAVGIVRILVAEAIEPATNSSGSARRWRAPISSSAD